MNLLNVFTAYQVYSYVTDNPTDVTGIMPIGAWISLLIAGLVIAPFFAFHKVRKKLSEFEDTAPNIIFEQAPESPLYNKESGEPRYHILQAWFKNKPIKPQEQSIGKQVTANIEFWDKDSCKKLFHVSGQWVTKQQAPDFVGFDDIDTKIDILPNNEYRKLLVALKWDDDDDAYGFALESFVHSQTQDGRDDGRKVPIGDHPVRIELSGIRVQQDFLFVLTNPGQGGDLTMVEMTKGKKKSRRNKQGITQKEFRKILDRTSQPIKKADSKQS